MRINDAGIVIEIQRDWQEAVLAQELQNIKDAIKRHQKRMAAYKEWSKPEAIAERLELKKESDLKATDLGKKFSRNLELLPVPDPLPKHMIGQSPSTVQAMLRSGWKPEDE